MLKYKFGQLMSVGKDVKVLRKIMAHFSKDSWYPGRGSKCAPPECKSEASSPESTFLGAWREITLWSRGGIWSHPPNIGFRLDNLGKRLKKVGSWDSWVGVATDWTSEVRFPAGERNVSLLHSIQSGSGAHTSSCPLGTRIFPQGESGRSVKLTIHLHLKSRPKRMVELYLHSSTLIKHRDNYTLLN
jgi:hypothetical protein